MNIDDLPKKYQQQVRMKLGHAAFVPTPAGALLPVREVGGKSGPRLRQEKGDGMNKTERAFFEWLKRESYDAHVLAHPITLRLANGVRYTPDFFTIEDGGTAHPIKAYEVKGFMRDDAAVKLKVAAKAYPWIKFTLVSKYKGGWEMQEIAA
jgi:hypothetical protein